MSSAVAGYKMSLGEDSVPVSYDDLEFAMSFLLRALILHGVIPFYGEEWKPQEKKILI